MSRLSTIGDLPDNRFLRWLTVGGIVLVMVVVLPFAWIVNGLDAFNEWRRKR